MSNTVDVDLVGRCRSGDRAAFETLLIKYEKPVFNAAFRMLHSSEDARDVTQTVFLKVYENLDKYDPAYRLFSWIYRIAMNESINCLSKQHRIEATGLESEIEGEIEEISPEKAVSGDQLRAGLQSALMRIKPEYRTVIVLKHFLGCSYSEISEILELSEKTIKSRLYTGRQLLKDELAESGIQ